MMLRFDVPLMAQEIFRANVRRPLRQRVKVASGAVNRLPAAPAEAARNSALSLSLSLSLSLAEIAQERGRFSTLREGTLISSYGKSPFLSISKGRD